MKKTSVALLAALFALALSNVAEGRPKRVEQIPNGEIHGCANCHVNPAGGGALNDFGRLVGDEFLSAAGFTGNVLWQSDLPFLDADGDGFTNGEELGDPNGAWRSGDEPNSAVVVSLPGDTKSMPASKDPNGFDLGPVEHSDKFDADERIKWADAAFQLRGSQEDYDRVMDADNPEGEYYAIQDESGCGGDRGLFGPDL